MYITGLTYCGLREAGTQFRYSRSNSEKAAVAGGWVICASNQPVSSLDLPIFNKNLHLVFQSAPRMNPEGPDEVSKKGLMHAHEATRDISALAYTYCCVHP